MSHTLGYGDETALHREIRERADAAMAGKIRDLRVENRSMKKALKRQREPAEKRADRNERRRLRRAAARRYIRNEPPAS